MPEPEEPTTDEESEKVTEYRLVITASGTVGQGTAPEEPEE